MITIYYIFFFPSVKKEKKVFIVSSNQGDENKNCEARLKYLLANENIFTRF